MLWYTSKVPQLLFLHENIRCGTHQKWFTLYFSMKTCLVVLIKSDSLLFLHENISCGTHQKWFTFISPWKHILWYSSKVIHFYFSMKTYVVVLIKSDSLLFFHENICCSTHQKWFTFISPWKHILWYSSKVPCLLFLHENIHMYFGVLIRSSWLLISPWKHMLCTHA